LDVAARGIFRGLVGKRRTDLDRASGAAMMDENAVITITERYYFAANGDVWKLMPEGWERINRPQLFLVKTPPSKSTPR
jgi:hypothetical protein